MDYRLVRDEDLVPFHRGIHDFCERHLPRDAPIPDETTHKLFADPIEGYADLTAWEVAIVDTPLFQRLRGIRQLGLAYLVYPTLGYCRFQHSLGVLARLKQVLKQLQENHTSRHGSSNIGELCNSKQRTAAQIAALCHDIGHCLFSHLSEGIVGRLVGNDNYPSSARILNAYASYAGRSNIAIAEVIAMAIITSTPFIKFLHDIGVPHAVHMPSAASLATDAARLIVGLPLKGDPKSLFLGQLMSSGLDVDKLDYMLREAHFSGISLGVSVDWLLKKLFVRDLSAQELPDDLQERAKDFDASSRFHVLSIEKGGQFAFEEFSVARLTLHEKIYLHQKIRAAEAFVRSRLSQVSTGVRGYDECHRWLYLKESQLEYPSSNLPALTEPDLFTRDARRDLRELGLERITSRDLLYRSFSFGWFNAIAEPLREGVRPIGQGTDQLIQDMAADPAAFLTNVQTTLEEMRLTLSEDFPDGSPEILVDLPRIASLQQGQETLYIDHPSQLPVRWTMPIDKIVEYYHKHRALAYVFTQRPFCPFVLLAAEKVIWDRYKLLYVQEAAISTPVVSAAKAFKQRLHEAGFYAKARQLQPISEFLGKLYPQRLVAKVSNQLAHYEPRTKRTVTPASVATYVSQFPADLQEAALEWLQCLEWIDPSPAIRRKLGTVLNDRSFVNASRIAICPLGATSDSANRISYELRDVPSDYPSKELILVSLPEALARRMDGYVLYDDNANTGKQALNIMAAWLGEQLPAVYALKEDHVDPLAEASRKELRSKPVGMLFAVGTEASQQNVTRLLMEHAKMSLNGFVCCVDKAFLAAERVFSGAQSPFQHRDKLRLKEFLQDVATQIFVKEGRSSEDAARRSLGYGQAEAMVVFPYNCPTMTIPALWLSGQYNNDEWLPLVERARRRHPDSGEPIGEDG